MSKLLEELRTLPEFNAFEKAVEEQLTADNYYVRENMPEVGKFTEAERDEDGGLIIWHGHITEEQALQQGIDRLVYDGKEDFDEFVTMSDLAPSVVELVRVLIKEIRK